MYFGKNIKLFRVLSQFLEGLSTPIGSKIVYNDKVLTQSQKFDFKTSKNGV